MDIRFIQSTDDRMAISHVYEQSWKYAYKGIIPQDYLDSIPEGRWASRLDDPGMHSLLALEGQSIVGVSSFCSSRFDFMEGFGEIVSIYLLPEYMGQGYGKRLLQASIDGLRSIGFNDVFLWVLEENLSARRFYENFGFWKSERFLNDNIGGKELKELQYRYGSIL